MCNIHGKGIKEKGLYLFKSFRFTIEAKHDEFYFDYEVFGDLRVVVVNDSEFTETSDSKIEEICDYLDKTYLIKELKSDLEIYRFPNPALLNKSPVEFAKENLEEDIK